MNYTCLTGTVTERVREDTIKSLLMTTCKTISIAAERPNIYLSQEKVKINKFHHFHWLVQALKSNDCPKTIIYCSSVPHVAKIYMYFSSKLGLQQYEDGIPSVQSRTIDMFHRSTTPTIKDHILSEFVKVNSRLRVVVASEAFGLGVDVSDIRVVIFYGAPHSLESYVQLLGRAGRDGKNSCAHLLHSHFQPLGKG